MALSDFELGIGIGSDISNIERCGWALEDTPKETLLSKPPVRRTKLSAIVSQDISSTQGESGTGGMFKDI